MYLPQHFAETRAEELHRIIREHLLGMLATEVVHAHGRLRIVDDEKFVRGIVGRLTRRHEGSEPRPWKMSDAPRDYLDQMLRVIVGIEVEVLRLEGKRKLGQNRDARDLEGAVRALHERGNDVLSSAMASTKRSLDRAPPWRSAT